MKEEHIHGCVFGKITAGPGTSSCLAQLPSKALAVERFGMIVNPIGLR